MYGLYTNSRHYSKGEELRTAFWCGRIIPGKKKKLSLYKLPL